MPRLNYEQRNQLISEYQSGCTTPELRDRYDITIPAIHGLLRRRDIVIRKHNPNQKYEINESFFDSINSQEKSYFLGLLYADGSNNTDKGRNTITLQLQKSDRKILEKLNDLIGSSRPLQYIENQGDRSDSIRLSITNKHFSQRLELLGCPKAKTFKITFPNFLSKQFIPHFIRGYYDGDGSLSFYKKNGPRYKRYQANFSIVGTEEFVMTLQTIFLSEVQVNSLIETRHKERQHNIRTLRVSGNNQINRLLKWLYADSTIHIERKFQKFIELENIPKKEKRICDISDCQNKHLAKGYCSSHYYRFTNQKEKRHQKYLNSLK